MAAFHSYHAYDGRGGFARVDNQVSNPLYLSCGTMVDSHPFPLLLERQIPVYANLRIDMYYQTSE